MIYALYGLLVILIVFLLWVLRKGINLLIQLIKGYGVPNVTTAESIAQKLIELIDLKKGDCFFDLGAGKGAVVSAIAKAFPAATCIGYEYAPDAFTRAQLYKKQHGGNYEIINADFFSADFSQASHIYCYLMPYLMKKVRKKIDKECAPGTLLYVNAFPIPNVQPIDEITLPSSSKKKFVKKIYMYEKK